MAGIVAVLACAGPTTPGELERRIGRPVGRAVIDLVERGLAVIEGDLVGGLDLDP